MAEQYDNMQGSPQDSREGHPVYSAPTMSAKPDYKTWGKDKHMSDKGAETGTGYDASKDPWTTMDKDKAPSDWNELDFVGNGKVRVR